MLRQLIAADPAFDRLTKEERKDALNGKWRLKRKWEDLAALADQHRKWFVPLYRHLCGHSHTSYISALQLAQGDSKVQTAQAEALLGVGCHLMSPFLKQYRALSSRAASVLPTGGDAHRALEQWHITADLMERHWFSEID